MEIKRIFVIGAGQMGCGIAQVAAQAGFDVVLNDIKQEFVDRGLGVITGILERSISKGNMSAEDKNVILSRIKSSVSLEDAKDADLVIEAAVENLEIKFQIFKTLDNIVSDNCILATNTSSLPITEIAAVIKRPERFIGMHFFNPVPVMELVEVIRGLATSDEVYQTIEDMSIKMGKSPVEVNDSPGFVANRVLLPMINEAIYSVYEGVTTPEGVDKVMKLGAKHPMGPLELADFIGLDTCLAILEVLYQGFGDSKYRPCPLLRKYVKAGWLGKKTSKGFYDYTNQ